MKYILLIIIVLAGNMLIGQNDVNDTTSIDEILISANKTPEKRSDVAQQVQIIGKKYIQSQSPLNTADLLQSTGSVFVQKSQQGGGSPVLRGFEASRILLAVDGVRMNNFIYRAGHLQNVITLDPNIMDRIEILNGPASTVYGSDALGGVIHFKTKDPLLSDNDRTQISGTASTGFQSANNGQNVHVDLNVGGKKLASLSSVTLTRFGDLKMGGSKNPFNDDGFFGERKIYVTTEGGQDQIVTNDNELIQRFSGYKQIDVLQKLAYKPSENITHTLNLQYSSTTDIPRYDRLTDPSSTGLKSAQWYYGPQKRLLAIYHFNQKSKGFFDSYDINVNYQNIEESRYNRNFGSAKLNNRIENVQVAGIQLSATHRSSNHEVRTGIDGYWNGLKSTAFQQDIRSNAVSLLDTRYPDGQNNQINIAAYTTHTYHINEHWILNDGLRLGYNQLKSTFKDKSFFPFPFDEVKQNNFLYSASAGIIYKNNGFKASYLASLGFRTPNVDDLSKVFESAPGVLIIPNPFLKPESTINNELNIGYYKNGWSIENVVYYTSLSNFISLAESTFNGQGEIEYNGSLSKVFTTVNRSEGYVIGLQTLLRKKFSNHLTVYGSFGYTYGRNKNEGITVPMDHISPILTKVGVESSFNKLNLTFFILSNGKKDIKDYSPSGEDNAQYAPANGMPAWMTLNIKATYQLTSHFSILGGIENILDTQYRYFASGINAPGRNIMITARCTF